MKKVHSVNVVCDQGAACYYIGRELNGGEKIDSIEDESWEGLDGIFHVIINLKCKDKIIGRLINVPVDIHYEKEEEKLAGIEEYYEPNSTIKKYVKEW